MEDEGLQFKPKDSNSPKPKKNKKGEMEPLVNEDQFAVIYDYGAFVFFNCETRTVRLIRDISKAHCSELILTPATDEIYEVVLRNSMRDFSKLEGNRLLLQRIDMNSLQVIGGVLGQSVALSQYEQDVEGIFDEFQRLNVKISHTDWLNDHIFIMLRGYFSETQQRKKLFKLVANNNTIMSQLLQNLNLLDRKVPANK